MKREEHWSHNVSHYRRSESNWQIALSQEGSDQKMEQRNVFIGVLLGIVAGILDVIPMVLQGFTWDANLGAFSLWVVAGFFLATSKLEFPPVAKGVLISFLCLLPSAFLIGWEDPSALAPIGIMTLILGTLLGLAYGQLSR